MSDWGENLEEARNNHKPGQLQAAVLKVGPRNYVRPYTIPAERFAQGSYLDFYIRKTGEDGVEREKLHKHFGEGKLWSTDIPVADETETYKACSDLELGLGIGTAVLALWALTGSETGAATSTTPKAKLISPP